MPMHNTDIVMVNACYKGWYLEYSGYIAASGYSYPSGTEYICLDGHPDTISGVYGGVDTGAVLYLTEGVCGDLKGPPYVNHRELTSCVVCSK